MVPWQVVTILIDWIRLITLLLYMSLGAAVGYSQMEKQRQPNVQTDKQLHTDGQPGNQTG